MAQAKRESVTYSTDRENEVSKIFIVSLRSNLNLAGRTVVYGQLNWPITARVLTERYIITWVIDYASPYSCPLTRLYVSHWTGSRVPLLRTPIPASYIAVEEAVSVIRERCYRDDQTPVLKSEQFRYRCLVIVVFTLWLTLFALIVVKWLNILEPLIPHIIIALILPSLLRRRHAIFLGEECVTNLNLDFISFSKWQFHVEIVSLCFFGSAAVEGELARQKVHLRGPEELQQATRFLHDNGTEMNKQNRRHMKTHSTLQTTYSQHQQNRPDRLNLTNNRRIQTF